jgi:hypothetical protein
MRMISESNKMEIEIIDIFKKDSEIFFLLRYFDYCFDISVKCVDKSMKVGDWKIIE